MSEASAVQMAKIKQPTIDVVKLREEIQRHREILGKIVVGIVNDNKKGHDWMVVLSDIHAITQHQIHILKHLERLK